jgi:hypothetical protein
MMCNACFYEQDMASKDGAILVQMRHATMVAEFWFSQCFFAVFPPKPVARSTVARTVGVFHRLQTSVLELQVDDVRESNESV